MEAQTFKLKTPEITGGRSHTPLARTDLVTVLLNYYARGRKNKLHTHPGQDHVFVVLDGEATFYDKDDNTTVLKKGEGIMLPNGWYYSFENTGDGPLALLRFGARKEDREIGRIEKSGRTSGEDTTEYLCVDGSPIEGQEWEMS